MFLVEIAATSKSANFVLCVCDSTCRGSCCVKLFEAVEPVIKIVYTNYISCSYSF